MRVALIGCGAEKLDRSAPARQLYTGQLFRAALAHAERHHQHVRVLSAQYGLVALDQVLDPYDLPMARLSEEQRADWAHEVMVRLADEFGDDAALTLVVFAGATYVEPLRWQLPEFPAWLIEDPLVGLSIGERLAWFKARRAA